MLVQSRQRLDLLQLVLGLKTASKVSEDEDAPRLRPQPNAFSDLMNAQFAQATSALPRPVQKQRPPAKSPPKREPPDRERRGRESSSGQQRLSAWA